MDESQVGGTHPVTKLPHSRIDSHLHLWDRRRSEYKWITPDLGELYDDFPAETAAHHLVSAGIDGAILVQAEDSYADTHFMFDAAAANDWVVGVVGWIPIDDPAAASDALADWNAHPVFCGVRQLIHIDARRDLLDSPAVAETLRLIAGADLAFDVPNAWPRHMKSVGRIAASNPELTVVVDHLGTPPAGSTALEAWERAIRDVAAQPNTVAKVSGLQHLTAEPLRRAWDVALHAFGPSRLIYGSDWPMTVPYGGYEPTWHRISALISELTPFEQDNILSGTAHRAYRLTTTSKDRAC